jgi:hypothetical protein
MQVRYPLSVPILYASQGGQAKQITFWVWKTDDACADEAELSFSSSEDIVWLNQTREEVGPSLQIQAGGRERTAIRYSLYIYTPIRSNPNTNFTLTINLNSLPTQNILLHGQSQFEGILLSILHYSLGTFGIPFLTALTGVLATGYNYFKSTIEAVQQQRRQDLEMNIEKLNKISGRASADIGLQYISLIDRIEKWGFGNDEVILSAARRAFKTQQEEYSRARIWAFTFRKEITRRLPEEDFESWLEKSNKNINFLSDDEFQTIVRFSKNGLSEISTFEQLLNYGLKAFGILGVDNVDELCNVIARAIPTLIDETDEEKVNIALVQVKDNWFTKGASGRYLSGKLAYVKIDSQFISALQIKLIEWKNREDYPSNLLGRNALLWASEPLYSLTSSTEVFLKRHFYTSIPWRTPFGPVKSEFDPRLTRPIVRDDKRPVRGFFWEDHPIWKKVIEAKPLCVTAEHGMGSTALILMGRHVRRFWGRNPSLSIFLQPHGNADENMFWSMVERSLFEQLIRDLVEDFFWLLNAPVSFQQMIVSFLVRQAGGFSALLLKIDEAGLLDKEREVIGLVLFDMGDTTIYQSHLQFVELIKMVTHAMLEAASRPRIKDDQFYTFVWVEFKDATAIDGWMELIERAGLNSFVILKVFAPAPLYSMKVRRSLPVETLHWDRQQLKDMITKRIKQTKDLSVEHFPLDELLDKAAGSPARLIEEGNQYEFPGD